MRALDGITFYAVLSKPKSVSRCFSVLRSLQAEILNSSTGLFTHVKRLMKGLLKNSVPCFI